MIAVGTAHHATRPISALPCRYHLCVPPWSIKWGLHACYVVQLLALQEHTESLASYPTGRLTPVVSAVSMTHALQDFTGHSVFQIIIISVFHAHTSLEIQRTL